MALLDSHNKKKAERIQREEEELLGLRLLEERLAGLLLVCGATFAGRKTVMGRVPRQHLD